MSRVGYVDAVIVGVARHVEKDVPELVGQRERCAIGSDSGAIFDDHVANAGAIRIDERLADTTPAGEGGIMKTLDRSMDCRRRMP